METFVSSPASTTHDAPTPTPNGGWHRQQQQQQQQQQIMQYNIATGSSSGIRRHPSEANANTSIDNNSNNNNNVAHTGQTPQRTPPFVFLQGSPSNSASTSTSHSTDSEGRLPTNQIHILSSQQHPHPHQSQYQQTYPNHGYHQPHPHPHQQLYRSTSTYSTNSVPALSNGPSPLGQSQNEEILTDIDNNNNNNNNNYNHIYEQPYQPQYPHNHGHGQSVSASQRTVVSVSSTSISGSRTSSSSRSPETAFSNLSTNPAGASAKDEPLEPGAGIAALAEFVDAMSSMEGGTYEEWENLVEEHFDDDGRFSLTLTGEDVRVFDIPSSSLPRFFITLAEIGTTRQTFVLRDTIESPNINEGQEIEIINVNVESTEFEWRSESESFSSEEKGNVVVVRKGSLTACYDGKIERVEIVLDSHTGQGYGLPEEALRVLEVAQQMEHLAMVMELTEGGVKPQDALQQLTEG